MSANQNRRPPKLSRLDRIVTQALEQTRRKSGATALDVFTSGLSCSLTGLALIMSEALPAAVHALGSVSTFVGLTVMVLTRRKL